MDILYYSLIGALFAIVFIVFVRTFRFKPKACDIPQKSLVEVDVDRAQKNLSNAIKFITMSNPDPNKVDWQEFVKFHEHLERSYPLIDKTLNREIIDNFSLLYKWTGSDDTLNPIALLSHFDVVPVMPGTEDDWTHDAFSGAIDDGFIWGRGTLDMKGHLTTVMEAVEGLISKGFTPKRTVYLCFGHNEEIVGAEAGGAYEIMKTLQSNGVKLECIIDEGGAVTQASTLGTNKNVAVISIAEKGYADLLLTVDDIGGHSSQPPKKNGLSRMANILINLEKHPFKKRLTLPVLKTFVAVGPNMPFINRMLISNLWLFKPLFLSALASKPMTNAMVRTTGVATMAKASPAANVLPQKTQFTLNFRTLPGDRIEDVINHIKKISKDSELKVELLRGKESSAIAQSDTVMWNNMSSSLRKVFGDIIVAPYLMMGGTDSCMYEPICDNIYRISPFLMTSELLRTVHSTNERISIEQLENGIKVMTEFILISDN